MSSRKDTALLAAVAGYEAIRQPGIRDRQQFARLFVALFDYTSEETRRTAASALSRLVGVPSEIARTIAKSPIDISAPFLAFGLSLDDDLLVEVIENQDLPHARAIARRSHLSDRVRGALRIRFETHETGERREERLRDELRALVRRPLQSSELDLPSPAAEAAPDTSLVEAAAGGRWQFAELLARRLESTVSLADRILMDNSGRQLAMTLQALELDDRQIVHVLGRIFPHLQQAQGERTLAAVILDECDPENSREKVSAWQRANRPRTASRTRYAAQVMETRTRSASATDRRHSSPAGGTYSSEDDKSFSQA